MFLTQWLYTISKTCVMVSLVVYNIIILEETLFFLFTFKYIIYFPLVLHIDHFSLKYYIRRKFWKYGVENWRERVFRFTHNWFCWYCFSSMKLIWKGTSANLVICKPKHSLSLIFNHMHWYIQLKLKKYIPWAYIQLKAIRK